MTAPLMSGIALHMSSPKRQKSSDVDEVRGARLVYARRLTKLSQKQIADAVGVARQSVIEWEKGGAIEEWRMDAVAAAYNASRGWIRYGEGDPPPGGSGLPLDFG